MLCERFEDADLAARYGLDTNYYTTKACHGPLVNRDNYPCRGRSCACPGGGPPILVCANKGRHKTCPYDWPGWWTTNVGVRQQGRAQDPPLRQHLLSDNRNSLIGNGPAMPLAQLMQRRLWGPRTGLRVQRRASNGRPG